MPRVRPANLEVRHRARVLAVPVWVEGQAALIAADAPEVIPFLVYADRLPDDDRARFLREIEPYLYMHTLDRRDSAERRKR